MIKVLVVHKTGFYDKKTILDKLSGYEVEYIETLAINEVELAEKLANFEYLMINQESVTNLTPAFYKKLQEVKSPLKHISVDHTGFEWTSPELAKGQGIKVSNIPHYASSSTAEFTIATILFILKKLYLFELTENKSEPIEGIINDDVFNKTIGVIGLGSIGGGVAKMAHGLGMKVLGWNKSEREIPGVEMVELEKLVKESDIITIHLSTNDETRALLNEALFSKAENKPYVFNHTSESLLDTDMVLKMLNNGTFKTYSSSRKYIPSKEVLEHPNCISVPHQGWFTYQSMQNLENTWIENFLEASKGNFINLV
ncbi:hypothetical protein KBD09_03670 [Candidatus Woesebacteria bacterium]|nr:hypothetical protein [Candidatus Woesebacteria bacterium]